MKKIALLAGAAAVAALSLGATAPAEAGGLFGHIHGWVGKQLHSLDHHVFTPLVKGVVVGAGTVLGAAGGTYVGLPVTGGIAGGLAGECINQRFAGSHNCKIAD